MPNRLHFLPNLVFPRHQYLFLPESLDIRSSNDQPQNHQDNCHSRRDVVYARTIERLPDLNSCNRQTCIRENEGPPGEIEREMLQTRYHRKGRLHGEPEAQKPDKDARKQTEHLQQIADRDRGDP